MAVELELGYSPNCDICILSLSLSITLSLLHSLCKLNSIFRYR